MKLFQLFFIIFLCILPLIYFQTGDFNVSMLAINPLGSFTRSYKLNIGGSMKDTLIVLPEQTLLANLFGFVRVVWTAIDSSACICIDFDNGTRVIYGAQSGCTNCSGYTYANQAPVNNELKIRVRFSTEGTFTVTMDTNKTVYTFMDFNSTYIQIVASPLRVSLSKGGINLITRGVAEIICFEPQLFTIDPDLDVQNFTGWTWTWICRQQTETHNPNRTVSPKLQNYQFSGSRTGCFGDGPGVVNFATPGKPCFWAGNMEIGSKVYHYEVKGSSADGRSGVAKISVQVVNGIPPVVNIQCMRSRLCKVKEDGIYQFQEVQFNPSDDLLINASCITADNTSCVDGSWELQVFNNTVNDFVILTSSAVFIRGMNSLEMSLLSVFWERYKTIPRFKSCYMAKDEKGIRGKSCIQFFVLPLPSGINCTLDRTVISQIDNVCCSCTSQPGLEYRVYLNTSGQLTTLGFNNSGGFCSIIPYSENTHTYMVRVTNQNGGFIDVNVAKVKVEKLNTSTMDEILKNLESGNDKELDLVNAKGDFRKMSEIYLKYVSVLTVSSQNTMLKIFGPMTENAKQNFGGTGYDKAPIKGPTRTIDDLSQEDQDFYENDRDKKSAILVKMTSHINDMVAGDIKSLYLISDVVKSITNTFDNLNRQSQSQISNNLRNLANSLESMSPDAPRNDVQNIALSLMTASLQTDAASNTQINRGILRDIKEAKDNFLDYDTSLDSKDKSFMNTNPQSASNLLVLETNSNYQGKVASGVKSNNGATMQTITKVLRDITVIDDKPTELNSAFMQYVSLKTMASKISETQLKKGRSQIKFPDLCKTFKQLQPPNICDDPNNPIGIEVMATPNNVRAFVPNPNGAGLPIPTDSETFSVNIFFGNGNSESKLSQSQNEEFEMFISRDPSMNIPEFNVSDPKVPEPRIEPPRAIPGTGSIFDGPACYEQKLVMHQFTLTGSDQSVHFQIKPKSILNSDKKCVQYLIVGRMAEPAVLGPTPDGTADPVNFTFWGMLPSNSRYCSQPHRDLEPDPYTFFVSNDMFNKAKKEALDSQPDYSNTLNTLYFGLRQLRQDELDKYDKDNRPPTPYKYSDQINVSYTTRIYSTGCYHIDESSTNAGWKTNGCKVGPLTTPLRTQCLCTHLTAFAGGWIVAPNTIDFDYVFSNFDFTKNLTLFVTEIVIFLVFVLITVWARRQDIKDIEKVGVTPMSDNETDDMYLYELAVDTGIRNSAGTQSNVCFILSGELDETDPRKLEDEKRPILVRGNVDRFLMAVPRSLGNLQYIRLWHDNTGKGRNASWYCNYFGVTDLQTKEKFHFLVNRWFAVEEDDGQIDRLIAVASVDELMQFGEVFTRKMKQDLTEGHLWLSIMARPPESRFTRVERVICCLLLLFLTMLTTCMFYQSEGPTKKEKAILTIGPFALTPKEVWTGLISNLIAFIPLFLFIELFRRSQLRHGHANKLRQVVEEQLAGATDSGGHSGANMSNSAKSMPIGGDARGGGISSSTVSILRNEEVNTDRPDTPGYRAPDQVNVQVGDPETSRSSAPAAPKQKLVRKRLLPWWTRIIVWCLMGCTLIVAIFFTTLYGIQFGDSACKKWISSMFISFFASVLLTQPIKVILLAMFFSLVCKKSSNKLGEDEFVDEEDELMNELGQRNGICQDEEYLHGELYGEPVRPARNAIQPPPKEEVEKARELRLRDMKMFDVLREILFYLIYFCTLLLVTYSLRDPNSFLLKTQLEKVFITPANQDYQFAEILKEDKFWDWAMNVLVPSLRASVWYNSDPPLFQRGFTSDRSNRLIGYAIIRQLRVKNSSCQVYSYVQHLVNACYSPYSISNEEKANFSLGWGEYNDDTASTVASATAAHVDPAFTYRSQSQMDSLPYAGRITYYMGGGYVHEFRGKSVDLYNQMQQLRNNRWIDAQTRALFIEFTTYNPNINLFAVNTYLVEMPGSAGMWPSYRIEPANLLGMYSSGVAAFEIFCQAVYMLFIISMIVKEIRNIIKQKWTYFTNFWNICEVFLICGSFACVAAFAYVKIATGNLTQKFLRYGGNVYINFQLVAFWNEYLSYLVSFIVFVATLKFIRLLRFNRRMGMLGAVLSYSARDMKQFFIIFAIMFLAFVMVFYSLFMDSLYRYHTFLHATEASMQIALGKFEFLELYQKEPIFGPIVFAVYVIFIIFVMLNMFVAILNEGFAMVRADIELQSNDYELVEYVMTKFIMWTGINNTKLGQKFIKTGVTDQIYKDIDSRQMAAKVNAFPDKVDQLLNHVNRIITGGDKRADTRNSGNDNKSFSNILFEAPASKPRIKGGDDSYDDQYQARPTSRPGTGSSNILRQRAGPTMTPIDQ